jgi:transcription-repair coupling factor (superfamily II helicase)
MARRGVVGVFSFGQVHPLRLEFDGDEIVDALVRADVAAVRRALEQRALLLPRREMVIDEALAEAAAAAIQSTAGDAHDAALHAAQLRGERYYIGMRRISGFVDQGWGSAMRYFPADLLTVRDRANHLAEEAAAQAAEVAAAYEERRSHHEIVSPPEAFLGDWAEGERRAGPQRGFDLDAVRRTAPIAGSRRARSSGRSEGRRRSRPS